MTSEEKSIKLAKLDWYREVINLEPNSKLFLQLARLLAELGVEDNNATFMNEAFEVLRRGLSIHPDYMEARLYLIELLNLCGCRSQCGAEVARLASLFMSYPDFWDAWREHAITENESSDFTVALGFMSAIMRNKSLSIVQVLEAGLNALRTTEKPVFLSEDIQAGSELSAPYQINANEFAQVENVVQKVLQAPQEEHFSNKEEKVSLDNVEKQITEQNNYTEPKVIESKVSYNEAEETDSLHDVLPKEHVENYLNYTEQQKKKGVTAKQTLAELIKDANIIIEPRENSPFRTKSMADLLAEQGDYKGALDIYQELLTKGYGDKKELEERILDIKNLCPELDVKIDPSQLLAIDDYVDTSFGLMAKKELETNSKELVKKLDLPINDSYLAEHEEKEQNELTESLSETTQEVPDELEKSEDSIASFMNEEDSPLVDVPFIAQNEKRAETKMEDLQEDIAVNNAMATAETQENEKEDIEDSKEESLTQDLDLVLEQEENQDEQNMPLSEVSMHEQAENLDEMLDEALKEQEQKEDIFFEASEPESFVNEMSEEPEEEIQVDELAELDALLDSSMEKEQEDVMAHDISKEEQEPVTAKLNSDVADLLSKLAERLEVRAN